MNKMNKVNLSQVIEYKFEFAVSIHESDQQKGHREEP